MGRGDVKERVSIEQARRKQHPLTNLKQGNNGVLNIIL